MTLRANLLTDQAIPNSQNQPINVSTFLVVAVHHLLSTNNYQPITNNQ